jgi:hypothetical protein
MKQLTQYRDAQAAGHTMDSPTPFTAPQYMIIDGQQRANAISLGLQSSPQARLWIDLLPRPAECDMTYQFYLCTRAQPWGRKASEKQRGDARDALFHPESVGAEESTPRPADWELSLETTWPVAAALPVPFDKLVALSRAAQLRWEDVEALIPASCKAAEAYAKAKDVTRDRLPEFAKMLSRSIQQRVPLQLIPVWAYTPPSEVGDAGDESADHVAQSLETLFARLNTQGVRMGAEDLFFSAIKTRLPDAHDLVWDIDAKHGKLLPPPALVHMASRLVLAKYTKKAGNFMPLETVSVH